MRCGIGFIGTAQAVPSQARAGFAHGRGENSLMGRFEGYGCMGSFDCVNLFAARINYFAQDDRVRRGIKS